MSVLESLAEAWVGGGLLLGWGPCVQRCVRGTFRRRSPLSSFLLGKAHPKISIWWPRCRTHSLDADNQTGGWFTLRPFMRRKPQDGTPHAGPLMILLTEAAWRHLSGGTFLWPLLDMYSETSLPGLLPWIQDKSLQFFSLGLLDVWSQKHLS